MLQDTVKRVTSSFRLTRFFLHFKSSSNWRVLLIFVKMLQVTSKCGMFHCLLTRFFELCKNSNFTYIFRLFFNVFWKFFLSPSWSSTWTTRGSWRSLQRPWQPRQVSKSCQSACHLSFSLSTKTNVMTDRMKAFDDFLGITKRNNNKKASRNLSLKIQVKM